MSCAFFDPELQSVERRREVSPYESIRAQQIYIKIGL